MRFCTEQHRYYCGIDLHARSMYVCVQDRRGKTLVHRQLPTEPTQLMRLLKPYRRDVAVAVERLTRKHGKGKAMTLLAIKLGRAVYFMLRRREPFDVDRLVKS